MRVLIPVFVLDTKYLFDQVYFKYHPSILFSNMKLCFSTK